MSREAVTAKNKEKMREINPSLENSLTGREEELRNKHFTVYTEETREEKEEKLHFHQKLLKMIANGQKPVSESASGIMQGKDTLISNPQKRIDGKNKVLRIGTNLVDFLPIVGSLKMFVEGIRGKQFGTEKEMVGKQRLLHGISGALFFVLDLTSFGAIVSEIGKIGFKVGNKIISEQMLKLATESTFKEEGVKLTERGIERVERKEKIEQGV